MSYPTKKAKYSGELRAYPMEPVVAMNDGTVKTFREAFVGKVTENNEGLQKELEFYVPKKT